MKPVFYRDINNAIKCMHWRHGAGDIEEIRRYADGKIEVYARRHSCRPHKRTGRIETKGNGKFTIQFLRHQFTVTIIY